MANLGQYGFNHGLNPSTHDEEVLSRSVIEVVDESTQGYSTMTETVLTADHAMTDPFEIRQIFMGKNHPQMRLSKSGVPTIEKSPAPILKQRPKAQPKALLKQGPKISNRARIPSKIRRGRMKPLSKPKEIKRKPLSKPKEIERKPLSKPKEIERKPLSKPKEFERKLLQPKVPAAASRSKPLPGFKNLSNITQVAPRKARSPSVSTDGKNLQRQSDGKKLTVPKPSASRTSVAKGTTKTRPSQRKSTATSRRKLCCCTL